MIRVIIIIDYIKGSSTVMFRTPELRRHAIFSCTEWPGGVYATPTYAGSRPGANIAVCWATMNLIGLIEITKIKINSQIILFIIFSFGSDARKIFDTENLLNFSGC